jgi:hypothetical protein
MKSREVLNLIEFADYLDPEASGFKPLAQYFSFFSP